MKLMILYLISKGNSFIVGYLLSFLKYFIPVIFYFFKIFQKLFLMIFIKIRMPLLHLETSISICCVMEIKCEQHVEYLGYIFANGK